MGLKRTKKQDVLAWIHSALDDHDLDPFAFRVYAHLVRRSNDGRAWPEQRTIAEACRMSKRQVIRCVKDLQARRLLVITQAVKSKGGKSNTYHLTAASEWLQAAVDRESRSDCQSLPTQTRSDCQSPSEVTVSHFPLEEGNPKEGNPKGDASLSAPGDLFEIPEPAKKAGKTPSRIRTMNAAEVLALLPATHRTEDVRLALEAWIENRKILKRPMTLPAAKIAAKALSKVSAPEAIIAIDKATVSNWTGVFPGDSKGGTKFDAASGNKSKQDFGF